MSKYYTGIGSRNISKDEFKLAVKIGKILAKAGYILRSGAAAGADSAFERGAAEVDKHLYEVYLPYQGFKGRGGDGYFVVTDDEISYAEELYKKSFERHPDGIMPWFGKMKDINKKFHGRNVLQVYGRNNELSNFCVYFADEVDGVVSGGTRSAVELCRANGVPTFNLREKSQQRLFYAHLEAILGNK